MSATYSQRRGEHSRQCFAVLREAADRQTTTERNLVRTSGLTEAAATMRTSVIEDVEEILRQHQAFRTHVVVVDEDGHQVSEDAEATLADEAERLRRAAEHIVEYVLS